MPDTCKSGCSLGEASKYPFCDLLPEYATIIALGESPPARFGQLVAHLDQCVECQADLDDLVELTIAAYTERIEPPIEPSDRDLTFLQPIIRRASATHAWYSDRHMLVVFLSTPISQAAHEPSLTGMPRGQLLLHYIQEPRSVDDLEVSIDVYAEEGQSGQGRVRVSVEMPSRDPMDQAGSRVVLRANQAHWDGQTDDLGLVDFAPVPLNALPHMRVEITPYRADSN